MGTLVTPGVVIAGSGSGTGKTTIATGIMGALARRMSVAPFKVGPDYIDPGYHGLATGNPGRNLDSVMCGEDLIGPLYAHGAAGHDIAVVEGVMGLFDGRISLPGPGTAGAVTAGAAGTGAATTGPTTTSATSTGKPRTPRTPSTGTMALGEPGALAEGSTARIAQLLSLPVILVVDARGMSQSVGALVRGFATIEPGVRVAGVILNRVGSDRHAAVAAHAVEAQGIPVIGAVPRVVDVEVPSRHLGLITTAEWTQEATDAVAQMADMVEKSVDLDALVELAQSGYQGSRWDPRTALAAHTAVGGVTAHSPVDSVAPHAPVGGADRNGAEPNAAEANAAGTIASSGPQPTIAIAGGPAFSFSYAEHRELLQAAGAKLVDIDPLGQEEVSCAQLQRADGLIIPGGFPEEHVAELSRNQRLAHELQQACQSGLPVHAECAGLLWLLDALNDHPMCGVVPARAAMARRLTLGYRAAVATHDSLLWREGERVIGHEFHHTSLAWNNDALAREHSAWAWQVWNGGTASEGFVVNQVHASYLHTHPAAVPEAIGRFVAACQQGARAR